MKKILCIFVFVSVLLSLLCIGVSASDYLEGERRSGDSVRGISPDFSYDFLYISLPRSHPSSSFDFYVNGYIYLNGVPTHFDHVYLFDSGSTVLVVRNSSSATSYHILTSSSFSNGWDGYLYFDSSAVLPEAFVDWYNSSGSAASSSIDIGVTESIGFSGQVLSFIASTPGILALVGLSVAFAIIPFAVGKVKELIKGY